MKAGIGVKIAFLVLLLLLFCWQVVQAPWFMAIRNIEVKNSSTLTPWQVEQLAGVSRGMSLLKIDLDKVESRLEADSRILSAKLSRKLPGTLVIDIDENSGVAAVPYFSNWLEIDEEGRVLAVTTQFASLNLPVVTGLRQGVVKVGERIPDEAGWKAAAECLSRMPPSLQGEISELNVSNPDNIILYSRDPLRIVLGAVEDLDRKYAALSSMLDRVRADHDGDALLAGQLDVSSGKAVFSDCR